MNKAIWIATQQYYNGRIFNVTRSANVAAAQEVPFLLIRNPTGTASALRNAVLEINHAAVTTFTINAYIGPNITNNGTALTIRSHLVNANPTTSLMNAYGAPTIGGGVGNGTFGKGKVSIAPGNILDLTRSLILYPNKDLLFTAQHNTAVAAQGLNLFFEWVEVS